MERPEQTALIPRQPAIPGRSTQPLDRQDQALAPLLRELLQTKDKTGMERALTGAKLPFKSLVFLAKQPSLWPVVIWPVLINISLFGLGMYAVWSKVGVLVAAIWTRPELLVWYQYLLYGVWSIFNVIAHLLAIVMVYISVVVLGGIIASPFNDIISERTEALLLGERYKKLEGVPFLTSALSSVRSTAIIAMMYLGCLIPLLPLHLIPGIGSAAYTLIAGGVGAFFITMEYNDIILERKGFRMKAKFGRVWQERTLTLGFGAGTNLLLAIPLLNFLCIPLAVIGGAAMGLCLEQWELYPTEQPPQAPELLEP